MDLVLNKNKLAGLLILSLLFLMMVFQAQLYCIKIIILFIALILSKRIIYVSRPVKKYVGFLCAYGLWGVSIGIINLNENPFLGITTTILWPILSLFYINLANNDKAFNSVIKIIFFAHCFVVVYDLLYAFSIIYGFYFPSIYNVEDAFSYYGVSSRLNFINLNTLTFTTPFLTILMLVGYRIGINRSFQISILVLTFFLFILSGRRSVMAQMILIPFLAFLGCNNLSNKIKRLFFRLLILIIVLLVILISYFYFNYYELFEGYLNIFLKAFDSSQEPVKFLQHQSLMRSFMESPLFGHGFGAFFYDPGRKVYMNQMELQYQLSLAQTGIIGFILFIIAHGGLCYFSFRLSKHLNDHFLLANTFGYFFMLLSHATNPVLCSFDLMVSYFLILSRINYLCKQ